MNGKRIPFTAEDEERIASAGMWGMIVAIASIVSTLLSLITQVIVAAGAPQGGTVLAAAAVPGLIGLALVIILGVWLLQASLAFRKVALTDEADEAYLLEGFRKLRNYFMMTGILIIIALSGMVLLFCGALTCGSIMS
jgi:hypothetical protein